MVFGIPVFLPVEVSALEGFAEIARLNEPHLSIFSWNKIFSSLEHRSLLYSFGCGKLDCPISAVIHGRSYQQTMVELMSKGKDGNGNT